jgi:hypothetical protein
VRERKRERERGREREQERERARETLEENVPLFRLFKNLIRDNKYL